MFLKVFMTFLSRQGHFFSSGVAAWEGFVVDQLLLLNPFRQKYLWSPTPVAQPSIMVPVDQKSLPGEKNKQAATPEEKKCPWRLKNLIKTFKNIESHRDFF